MQNKELIDTHVANAQDIANTQAQQVKQLAGHHTARASETVKQYAGDYSSKAQGYIGSARGRSQSPEMSNKPAPASEMEKTPAPASGPGDAPALNSQDFPHAPKQEPVSGITSHQEQYQQSQFGGQAVPAS